MITRSTIFDGEIVETFPIPKEVMGNVYKKMEWGDEILTNYLRKFIGDKASWMVRRTRNREGRLTGTMAVFKLNEKQLTYALIEPKTSDVKPEVYISMLEEDTTAGDIFDLIDYKYGPEGSFSLKKPESPFAIALQEVKKEELPNLTEIVRLGVQKDRVHGGLMFAPTFKTSDPFVEGKSSMYLYYTDQKVELELGKTYRARILEMKNTGKTNAKGSVMIKVKIEL